MSDLIGIRGDTEHYDLHVVDADGVAMDLGDATLWFTIKVEKGDADTLALVRKETGDGIENATQSGTTKGWAYVTLEPDDTVRMLAPYTYYYDVQLKTVQGEVTTIQSGSFTLQADVTKTTTA